MEISNKTDQFHFRVGYDIDRPILAQQLDALWKQVVLRVDEARERLAVKTGNQHLLISRSPQRAPLRSAPATFLPNNFANIVSLAQCAPVHRFRPTWLRFSISAASRRGWRGLRLSPIALI